MTNKKETPWDNWADEMSAKKYAREMLEAAVTVAALSRVFWPISEPGISLREILADFLNGVWKPGKPRVRTTVDKKVRRITFEASLLAPFPFDEAEMLSDDAAPEMSRIEIFKELPHIARWPGETEPEYLERCARMIDGATIDPKIIEIDATHIVDSLGIPNHADIAELVGEFVNNAAKNNDPIFFSGFEAYHLTEGLKNAFWMIGGSKNGR